MNDLKYIEVNDINELKYSPQVFTKGAVASDKKRQIYVYNGTEWEFVSVGDFSEDAEKSGITQLNLNLYDLNKTLVSSLPEPTEDEMKKLIKVINNYHEQKNETYYMLLCTDYNYYTILYSDPTTKCDSLGVSVIDCLNNCGKIKTFDDNKNAGAIEIWVDIKDDIYMFYLFGYDEGVVRFA